MEFYVYGIIRFLILDYVEINIREERMNFKKIGIATLFGFVAMAIVSGVPLSALSYAAAGAGIGWALERFK